VVGVARDSKYSTLGEAPQPYVYMPLTQRSSDAPADTSLLVRTNGRSTLAAVRSVLRDMDPDLPVVRSGRLPELAAFSLLPHRAVTWLAASVGTIGLLLAAIGLYGVSAYNVSRRTREIGIRVAVGAATGQVMRLVVGGAAALTAIGAVIGLVLAAAAARLLSAFLYGVGPLDATAFVGGTLLLAAAAVAATLVPARRAARVDPMVALRAE
jgi:predicted lysophospholipase L1 biosynthesis ABC-type transport system permease subunit